MQRIRREICRVRHHDADGNFDWTIVNSAFDPVHNPTRDQTHGDTGDNQVGQAQHSISRSGRFVL